MEKIENKPKIFVIMPFGDTFFEAYEMIKNHFENRFDFSHRYIKLMLYWRI